MYKLLIVDDEEFEREGIANFIPWKDYDVEIVGTAWNGGDGFEKIQNTLPDIVLTDIKMPVMNGIELIRTTKKVLPDIEFIVLSGYGEFEFTSQAMEEGVRHYVLKPCDEEGIIKVLEKVKQEVEKKRLDKRQKREYQRTVHRLLPRAKEQLFRDLLLGLECVGDDYRNYQEELGSSSSQIHVIGCRGENAFDSLEQFVAGNICGDLLGQEKLLATTTIQNDLFLMIDSKGMQNLEVAIEKMKEQFVRIKRRLTRIAVSEEGTLDECHKLYGQVQELLAIGDLEQVEGILSAEQIRSSEEIGRIFDYQKLLDAKDYEEVLFQCCASFLKMDVSGLMEAEKKKNCGVVLKILYGEEAIQDVRRLQSEQCRGEKILQEMADIIITRRKMSGDESNEHKRMKTILEEVYKNIGNPDLSIQYLTSQILFMNQDYFGKLFLRYQNEKFSAFVLKRRIMLAKELIKYQPEIKISVLAELVGYSADGQYFSKAFRRLEGISPREYKDTVKCFIRNNK